MNYKEKTIEPTQLNKLFNDSNNLFDEYKPNEIINNIDDIMANSYMECAINNFDKNTIKIKLINRAYVFLLISLVDLFIAFLISLL